MFKEVELKIEKLNEKGYGVGFIEEKEYWILNALPGETVVAQIFKRKKGVKIGNAVKILTKSKSRIESKEEHFLSCSPWQILNIELENKYKQDLIKEFYQKDAEFELPYFDVKFIGDEFHYRNKMEFSFYGDENNQIHLALHKRDGKRAKYCIDSCILTNDQVNKSANKIVDYINSKGIAARQLKGLLTRYSIYENKVVLALYVKDENLTFDESEIVNLLDDHIKGIVINYSFYKSPAYVETQRLVTAGETDLKEKVGEYEFIYPYDGFFQINPESFELAVNDISKFIHDLNIKDKSIADVYGGVGTIGISVSKFAKDVISIEEYKQSEEYGKKNIELNNIDNVQFVSDKAEKSGLDLIKDCELIIVDPPRSGMHPKFIEKLLELKPKYIVYLSCNPKTQAQDFNKLKERYEIKDFIAYNFYPHTPHVESLAILELK